MPKRKAAPSPSAFDRVSLRLDLAGGGRIGPGKVAVLEAIAQGGSISAAGRALGMSYRRTWALVEDLNRALGMPVVEAAAGGSGGGGAVLTVAGHSVVQCYRDIERECLAAAGRHLGTLPRSK
jgi:molybdate transport system regulatory protein